MPHKFQDLGLPPYQLVGYEYDPPRQVLTEEGQGWAGGSHECNHCDHPIAHVFYCRSSDGKEFTLGSVHVEQLGDEGLIKAVQHKMRALRRDAARQKTANQARQNALKAAEQAKKRTDAIQKEYKRLTPVLMTKPHPNEYFATQGLTLMDYINYFLQGDNWTHTKVLSTLRDQGARI